MRKMFAAVLVAGLLVPAFVGAMGDERPKAPTIEQALVPIEDERALETRLQEGSGDRNDQRMQRITGSDSEKSEPFSWKKPVMGGLAGVVIGGFCGQRIHRFLENAREWPLAIVGAAVGGRFGWKWAYECGKKKSKTKQ